MKIQSILFLLSILLLISCGDTKPTNTDENQSLVDETNTVDEKPIVEEKLVFDTDFPEEVVDIDVLAIFNFRALPELQETSMEGMTLKNQVYTFYDADHDEDTDLFMQVILEKDGEQKDAFLVFESYTSPRHREEFPDSEPMPISSTNYTILEEQSIPCTSCVFLGKQGDDFIFEQEGNSENLVLKLDYDKEEDVYVWQK